MIDLSEVQNQRETLTGGIKKDQPSENLDIPANTFVYEIEGPLFFGTVRKFELATERAQSDCKYLVLRMRNTIYLDAGGIKALEQCKAACVFTHSRISCWKRQAWQILLDVRIFLTILLMH